MGPVLSFITLFVSIIEGCCNAITQYAAKKEEEAQPWKTGASRRHITNLNQLNIKSLQNRLLKVSYVPATSIGPPRLAKLPLFFAAAINSTNEANKAGGTCR